MGTSLYFLETSSPKLGRWFLELDRDSNSREEIIRQVDEYTVKVLEINEDEGTCRDVTDEFRALAEARREREVTWAEIQNRFAELRDHARKLRMEA